LFRPHVSTTTLEKGHGRIETRHFGHWGVEAIHWMLDVQFKDDPSRYRQGFGAKNMAVVRRFALDLVRAAKIKGSVKNRRLIALLDLKALLQILNA
jgi:predicted transposase YbfD/YdcC